MSKDYYSLDIIHNKAIFTHIHLNFNDGVSDAASKPYGRDVEEK